jgi:hypothetical protein
MVQAASLPSAHWCGASEACTDATSNPQGRVVAVPVLLTARGGHADEYTVAHRAAEAAPARAEVYVSACCPVVLSWPGISLPRLSSSREISGVCPCPPAVVACTAPRRSGCSNCCACGRHTAVCLRKGACAASGSGDQLWRFVDIIMHACARMPGNTSRALAGRGLLSNVWRL